MSAIQSLHFRFILTEFPVIFVIFALIALVIMGLSFYPLGAVIKELSHGEAIGCFWLLVIVALKFVADKLGTLLPFIKQVRMPDKGRQAAITTSFRGEFSAHRKNSSGTLRNLILLDSESFEAGFIGRLNRDWPKSMPHMSNLLENCTWFAQLKSQPYTTWSAAGAFVHQCGFPLVLSDVRWRVRRKGGYDEYASLPCLSHFLKKLGYHLYAVGSTASLHVMQIYSFFKRLGYRIIDGREVHRQRDEGLMNWLGKEFIPGLLRQQKQPFALVFLSGDTHSIPHFYYGDTPYIRQLKAERYSAGFLAFTWYDELVHRLLTDLSELGLNHTNTEFVITSDHLTMAGYQGLRNFGRRLPIIFPWRPQDDLWRRGQKKTMSLYDLAPTILSDLGIEYEPPFPWGANAFGPENGTVPTRDDIQFIYAMTTGDMKGITARCHSRAGFCSGNEY
jgi:hypothetical protein